MAQPTPGGSVAARVFAFLTRFGSLINLHAPREIVDALGKTGGSGKAAARSKDGASTKGPA